MLISVPENNLSKQLKNITMRKTNIYHDQILGSASAHNLSLDNLRKKYKLPFVVKLFKHLQKETRKKKESIPIIYPKAQLRKDFSLKDYMDELEDAGFKLNKWSEPFIDEDTGEIVNIPRADFKPLS